MPNRTHNRLAGLIPLGIAVVIVAVLLLLAQGGPADEGYLVSIIAWNILPYVVLAIVLAAATHRGWLWRTALVYSILAGLFALIIMAMVLLGESSTSVLAVVTLPAWLLAGMIPAGLIGWAVHRRRHGAR